MRDILSNNIIMEDEDQEEKKNGQAPDPLIEKFLKTRQIILSGEVCKELAEKIVKQLLILEADSDKPIYVYIDSPGDATSYTWPRTEPYCAIRWLTATHTPWA